MVSSEGTKVNGKQTIPPNQTLYCTNLPDKLQKEDLRRSLYTIFSTYGPVLDVVALKTMKMRGQAHIVFRDVQTSARAMRELQGVDFFGKTMRISYARGRSATISKLDGTVKALQTKVEPKVSSELQKSIFNAPPKASEVRQSPGTLRSNGAVESNDAKSPQGVKRPRESDDEDDAPMDEDDDAMEESDDD